MFDYSFSIKKMCAGNVASMREQSALAAI